VAARVHIAGELETGGCEAPTRHCRGPWRCLRAGHGADPHDSCKGPGLKPADGTRGAQSDRRSIASFRSPNRPETRMISPKTLIVFAHGTLSSPELWATLAPSASWQATGTVDEVARMWWYSTT
jgi:hypothetical protein